MEEKIKEELLKHKSDFKNLKEKINETQDLNAELNQLVKRRNNLQEELKNYDRTDVPYEQIEQQIKDTQQEINNKNDKYHEMQQEYMATFEKYKQELLDVMQEKKEESNNRMREQKEKQTELELKLADYKQRLDGIQRMERNQREFYGIEVQLSDSAKERKERFMKEIADIEKELEYLKDIAPIMADIKEYNQAIKEISGYKIENIDEYIVEENEQQQDIQEQELETEIETDEENIEPAEENVEHTEEDVDLGQEENTEPVEEETDVYDFKKAKEDIQQLIKDIDEQEREFREKSEDERQLYSINVQSRNNARLVAIENKLFFKFSDEEKNELKSDIFKCKTKMKASNIYLYGVRDNDLIYELDDLLSDITQYTDYKIKDKQLKDWFEKRYSYITNKANKLYRDGKINEYQMKEISDMSKEVGAQLVSIDPTKARTGVKSDRTGKKEETEYSDENFENKIIGEIGKIRSKLEKLSRLKEKEPNGKLDANLVSELKKDIDKTLVEIKDAYNNGKLLRNDYQYAINYVSEMGEKLVELTKTVQNEKKGDNIKAQLTAKWNSIWDKCNEIEKTYYKNGKLDNQQVNETKEKIEDLMNELDMAKNKYRVSLDLNYYNKVKQELEICKGRLVTLEHISQGVLDPEKLQSEEQEEKDELKKYTITIGRKAKITARKMIDENFTVSKRIVKKCMDDLQDTPAPYECVERILRENGISIDDEDDQYTKNTIKSLINSNKIDTLVMTVVAKSKMDTKDKIDFLKRYIKDCSKTLKNKKAKNVCEVKYDYTDLENESIHREILGFLGLQLRNKQKNAIINMANNAEDFGIGEIMWEPEKQSMFSKIKTRLKNIKLLGKGNDDIIDYEFDEDLSDDEEELENNETKSKTEKRTQEIEFRQLNAADPQQKAEIDKRMLEWRKKQPRQDVNRTNKIQGNDKTEQVEDEEQQV